MRFNNDNWLEDNQDAKQRLNQAFKEMRKAGIVAKQNFWCCQSCGSSAMPEGKPYVFYHNQDMASLKAEGITYLAYGSGSNDEQICLQTAIKAVQILNFNGIKTEWDGDTNTRIKIDLTVKPAHMLEKENN